MLIVVYRGGILLEASRINSLDWIRFNDALVKESTPRTDVVELMQNITLHCS